MSSPVKNDAFVVPVDSSRFNHACQLPHGLKSQHIESAMKDFVEFIAFINGQLATKKMPSLERFLMPANFSSMVGEFMNMSIPKYCSTVVKNQYHNGHPDLIPKGRFPKDAVQHSDIGLEIKGSRHLTGWQGHNPEAVWLMVFCFDSATAGHVNSSSKAKPFQFKAVYAAKLDESDWSFSGRTGKSRRTITAAVKKSGVTKMKENWVYEDLS